MASFKPKEIIRILLKLGFYEKRQSGSHKIMYNPDLKKIIPVPMHCREIKRGLVKGIIKEANSTEVEFVKLK